MEWRCEWCGKPHDEDDPPCDNCGHGSFEKAVVRQTDLAEEGRESTLVWVCTDCGREHPKHAPPCSRCGNPTLEKQRQRVDESELSAPGYLDLLTPKYAAVLGVTLLVAAVVVLGFAGVVDLPGFGGSGVPDVQNVPGNATSADAIPHGAVEEAYLARIDDARAGNGLSPLERTGGMDEIATFYNQRRVKWSLADGSLPGRERMRDLLGEECRGSVSLEVTSVGYAAGDDPDALGKRLAENVVGASDWEPGTGRTTGVDVHSADGRLFLTQFVCES